MNKVRQAFPDFSMGSFICHMVIYLEIFLWCSFVCAQTSDDLQSFDLTDVSSGQLLMRSNAGLNSALVLSTKIDVQVAGTISRTTVSQRFINSGDDWVEGLYVFPIGENAAIDTLKMRIGERFIEGEIEEKVQAIKIYQEAKEQGKKAALVEQIMPNIFTNKIANIAPGETVVVQIEFQQNLAPKDGKWELRIPLVVAPRYQPLNARKYLQLLSETSPKTYSNSDVSAPNVDSNYKKAGYGELMNPVDIEIDLAPGFTVGTLESLYHEVTVNQNTQNGFEISLKQMNESNRDFVLQWEAASPTIEASTFIEKHEGQEHALITLSPPETIPNQNKPSREIVFLQDVSGSMSGPALEQSKLGLELALKRLSPKDRFNLIFFSDDYWTYSKSSLWATQREIQKAIRHIRGIETVGGTEMYPALLKGLNSFESSPDMVRQLVFLTDGAVGNEGQLFDLISKELKKTRLFTIGIGSAPNAHFMRRAAEIGRGSTISIGEINEVTEQISVLFSKIQNPAVVDLQLILPDGVVAEAYPNPIPDLYAGEPITLSLKGRKLSGTAQIVGSKSGRPWSIDVPLDAMKQRSGVAKLWAQSKINSLESAKFDSSINNVGIESIEAEILKTALRYKLVSRLTSLVAVEKVQARPLSKALDTSLLPLAVPYGWDEALFGIEKADSLVPSYYKDKAQKARLFKASMTQSSEQIRLPQTSLNWKLRAVAGLLMLLLSLFYFLSPRFFRNA